MGTSGDPAAHAKSSTRLEVAVNYEKFFREQPGDPGFSVLRITKSGKYWGTCMQCGDGAEFRRIVVGKDTYSLW